jgi:hypothetical protein
VSTEGMKRPDSLRPEMIAPCGMDCGLCARHLRAKDGCAGCRSDETTKPKYCTTCRIRNCDEFTEGRSTFCFECADFPCPRLRQLDKRYRTKYGMSMIENLESIRALGLDGFVTRERERWKCPECGGLLRVHKSACIYCGRPRS